MSKYDIFFEEDKTYIDDYMLKLSKSKSHDTEHEKLNEAMKYSIKVGGKRIRPILTLEFCRACGGEILQALPFAVAVELIHNYSLIQDDLPCMDNDDERRGVPSCHIQYGEAYAMLASDALLTEAFSIISSCEISCEKRLNAISILSEAAGMRGMIAGQIMDIENDKKSVDIETLYKTDLLKTGKLIAAACQLGCIIGNASHQEMEAAKIYSENLGVAFQIVDDILDKGEIASESLNKAEKEKTTYISLIGAAGARKEAEKFTMLALEAIKIFGNKAKILEQFAIEMLNRKA